nr:lysophospholipid acyltransferase family protein [Sulfitobacter delicatus]
MNNSTADISYSGSAQTRSGRALIKVVENATGRLGLIRRARGYHDDLARGGDFWQIMIERYGISLDVIAGRVANIPASGPLVVVANHPFGILDGMILGYLLALRRGDFRILANSVFGNAPDLQRAVLPICFDQSDDAIKLNLNSRAAALEFLRGGGAIGVFPGGTVSTSARPFKRPMDPVWRRFTARMIAKSGATVVPVFFDGSNSQLFQLASHLNYTLRMALLVKEFHRRTDKPVKLEIGDPIAPQEISRFATDPASLMDFLRDATYSLAPSSAGRTSYGYEFEAKYRA